MVRGVRRVAGMGRVMVPDGEAVAREEVARWVAELRAARVSVGYSVKRLSHVLRVTTTAVYNWESGKSFPTLINLIKFGHELELRLVIMGLDGRQRSVRTMVKPGELWENREIRMLVAALRAERRGGGVSQDLLAERIGLSTWSLAQFEQGRLHPRPAVLAAWAAALDCGVRWRALV
jgi:transcriptional regulator with XRE-family HTH domain